MVQGISTNIVDARKINDIIFDILQQYLTILKSILNVLSA